MEVHEHPVLPGPVRVIKSPIDHLETFAAFIILLIVTIHIRLGRQIAFCS